MRVFRARNPTPHMNTVSIKSPYGTHVIPREPTRLHNIAALNKLGRVEMDDVLRKLVILKLVSTVPGTVLEGGGSYYYCGPLGRPGSPKSPMIHDWLRDHGVAAADDDTPLCPYREWTGKPLPTSAEELIDEYERLCEPTYSEYSDAKIAARNAVWDALERFRA